MIKFEKISIALLDQNTGQIPDVPRNPRKWGRRELKNLADLSVTDPPYNVGYTGKTAEKLKIGQDKMSNGAFHDFLVAAFTRMNEALKPGAANYVFFACKEARNFIDAYVQAGFLYKQLLIWVKNTITLTRWEKYTGRKATKID